MGWWKVSADTLAASRFVISPLAETTAGLLALERGSVAYPGLKGWLGAHRPGYRELLALDPIAASALRAALGRRWMADFLTPAPSGDGERTFAEELSAVRDADPANVRAELETSLD